MGGRRSRVAQRELLLEAFLGGWQAALGRYVHPCARPVVEACFDLWLEETADEVDILGLAFRRRTGLPQRTAPPLPFGPPTGRPVGQEEPAVPPAVVAPPALAKVARIPRQRSPRARDALNGSTRSRGRERTSA